jgi:hypothetical protein
MKPKVSNLILVFGVFLTLVMGFTSPSYFILHREGVVYKIPWVSGKHSPLIRAERDTGEVLLRVGLTAGATILFFLWLRKQGT